MGDNNFDNVLRLIIDTRRLTKRDTTIRAGIADGEYIHLAPTQVMKKSDYVHIATWRMFSLRAVAVGRSMRKGVVVARAAAALRGMWLLNRKKRWVEVALPSGGTPPAHCRMPEVRYRDATFRESELIDVFGVRTTSDIRTFIDIARYHGFTEGLIAADWLLSKAGYQAWQLGAEIDRMGRFVGKKSVRACVKYAVRNSESPYESLFRAVLIVRGMGGWEFQKPVGTFRPDFLFDGFLIVEIDGHSKYADRTSEVVLAERDRERALTNQGYVFLRLYPEELVRDMDAVMGKIAQARAGRELRPEERERRPAGQERRPEGRPEGRAPSG